MHVDEIALGVEVKVPHPFEQHGTRHHLSGATHQEFQELQLARGELYFAPAADDAAPQQIKLQIRDLELRGLRRAGASAQQGFDASQELCEREGLGEIVVAAGFQPTDPIVNASQGAQHQNGCRDAPLAHPPNDRETVDLGQHPIGHDQIEFSRRREEHAIAPVRCVIDGVAALTQALDEEFRRLGVVFDEQDVHGRKD